VGHALDLFVETDLVISGNIELRISHNLYSKSGRIEKVKKIYSHPQAFEQSMGWIRSRMAGVKLIELTSTAEAARRAKHEPDAAAIAGKIAGQTYGLKPIAERIEDYHQNFTRFLVIGRTKVERTGHDRTSLLLSLKDDPGILFRALEPFARRGINLSKIESRPLKRKAWEYLFFIDVDGHIEDDTILQALKEVKESCLFLKVLGSYPV
jgi:chorismate mutase/prephenate dehydratase